MLRKKKATPPPKDPLERLKKRRYLAQCPHCKEIAFVYQIMKDSIRPAPDGKGTVFEAVTDTLHCKHCRKDLSYFFSRKATLMVTRQKKPS